MVKPTELINGVQLIIEGDMVLKAAQRRGAFEPDSLSIWNNIAKRKGLMLDIGAYTGIYCISAALLGSKVVAFEPNPLAAKRCFENSSINKVQVDIQNKAAWNIHALLSLNLEHGNLTSAATVKIRRGINFKVHAVPIDSYEFDNVTAMKIDAERAEVEVLEGAIDTITRYLPVLLIEELDKDMGERIQKVIGHLGYVAQKLTQSMAMWSVR